MKIFKLERNKGWIDVLPTLMLDWGNKDRFRIYIGWLYWTLRIAV